MSHTPAVTPVIGVSLAIVAVLAIFLVFVPYKPRPDRIAEFFLAVFGVVVPALATVLRQPLYPAALNISYIWVGAFLLAIGVLSPLSGVAEAKLRKADQIFAISRLPGHLLTNVGGALGAAALVWMGQSMQGFGSFTDSFSDAAALNCLLPVTLMANFAFLRWQQTTECPDLDECIKRGEDWEPSLIGFSLKHVHQLLNLTFLIAVTFTATTTLLYLFAFALKQAKAAQPLSFSWQISVGMLLSVAFFYACGLKWSRGYRAVYLTFLTGTPAALGAVLVWLALLKGGTARNIFAVSVAVVGYLLYCVEAIFNNRDTEEKLELYYFATALFAMVLAALVGALYIFGL